MASDRFREFEVFVCVVDAGSFSGAARRLDCTPSAVSKLIDRLEGRMGTRLLQRSSRALALTAEGRKVARQLPVLLSRVQNEMLQPLSLAEWEQLKDMLRRVLDNALARQQSLQGKE